MIYVFKWKIVIRNSSIIKIFWETINWSPLAYACAVKIATCFPFQRFSVFNLVQIPES